jgi:hypothetical protein
MESLAMPEAALLLVAMGVGGWTWPSYASVMHSGTASFLLRNNPATLALACAGKDLSQDFADDVDGTIERRLWLSVIRWIVVGGAFRAQIVIASNARPCLGLAKVGGITFDVKLHITTGAKTYNGVGVGGTIIEELVDVLNGGSCS